MAAIEVFRNEYTTISMDPRGPLVRMVRSAVPFPSIASLERNSADLIHALDEMGRDGRVLLNDIRAIPGRNDSTFEERMRTLRPRLYRGFVRVGLLVRSSVGALQIRRMVQEDGIARMVTTDETALLEYLLYG